MQLYFVRHAQSTNNALWASTGSDQGRNEDPELTELGKRQARRVAEFLRSDGLGTGLGEDDIKNVGGFRISHLYSSLMLRAVQTGHAISEALGLPLHPWVDIHETGGMFLEDPITGELAGKPGMSRGYFAQHYPRLVADTVNESGWWGRAFEAYEERRPRAERFLRELMERHGGTDHRVAIVSHGGFYNYLMACILNIADKENYWFAINNTAITRVDFQDGHKTIAYMNRTDHLPLEWIT
jgi:2,3-bisphosphoglycerate-dependent phosphoglycerate mutase